MFSNRVLPSYWTINQRLSLSGETRDEKRDRYRAGRALLEQHGYFEKDLRHKTKAEADALAEDVRKKTGLELTVNETSPL